MKIVFFETQEWEKKYLTDRLQGHELVFNAVEITSPNPSVNTLSASSDSASPPKGEKDKVLRSLEGNENSSSPAKQADGGKDSEILCSFINFHVDKAVLEKYPKLKFIATRSTGYDHIDLKACAAKNIQVSNVPTYGENTVAEFAFALLLSLSRKIYPAIKRVREEGHFNYDGLKGFDLKGKVLGIVGAGHIGMHMIRMAKGFEMHPVAYDPHPKEELAKEYGFEYLSLDDLLKQSDVVSLHVPYLPATHHLIDKEKFKLFKKGSILINTARGGLVETAALVEALASGRLAGAGMDVLEEEGFVKEEAHMLLYGHPNAEQLKTVLADHELMQMENVIITPHNAFNTQEALERILDTTIVNIQSFAQGRAVNLVGR